MSVLALIDLPINSI